MNVDITIRAYMVDGDFHCPSCTTDEDAKDCTLRLYGHNESEYADGGLYCAQCSDVIFEDQTCPECDDPLYEHVDLIGAREYCPSAPTSTVRIVESIDGKPFNVAVYHEEVAGEGEDALRSIIAFLGGKVATVTLEDPS